MKQESSDSSLSESDSSEESDFKTKRRNKKKKYQEKKQEPIKLFTKLTGKLPTKAYKSKILKFKLDEDPLQCRIYFITL